eukprot:2341791-Ditylum_brightwellii.AAC.1
MKMFHSPKMFGGTRSRTQTKLIGMIGMGPSTYEIEFETSTLLARCTLRTPKAVDLKAYTNEAAIAALPTPTNRSAVTFSGCAYFIPALFLRDTIINTDSDDPLELIP